MKTIWSNMNLNLEDWREDMDTDERAMYTDDDLTTIMEETNAYYLEDEIANLDMEMPNTLVAIVNLGLWSGRERGYRMLIDEDKCINSLEDLLANTVSIGSYVSKIYGWEE